MEDLLTGERIHISSAYVVYVALGDDGKPCRVPPLIPETDEDRRRMANAARRKAHRQRAKTPGD
jgi:acyl-CoA hydrolase